MRAAIISASIVVLSLQFACSDKPQEIAATAAGRVFLNGAVYTVDAERSWAEAVAIRGGEIVFVGSNTDAKQWIDDESEVIDLAGAMMLPGFHDSHTHLLIGVLTDDECSLMRLESISDVEAALRLCAELDGFGEAGWVLGGGWGEWLWPEANPNKAQLDVLFPDRPVYLESSFGHAAWINTRAMELSGIDANTDEPLNGIIEHDPETGAPSGTLRESAMLLVKDKLPPMTMEQRLKKIRAALDMAHSLGVTAVIEPGLDDELIEPVVSLADGGELDLRVLASLSPINWQPGSFGDEVYEFLEQRERWRRPNIDIDSVKIYMDGVIEYGTSTLLEPYATGDYGLGPRFYSQQKVNEYLTRFDAMGLQVHVHAIGDAAIRMALDGFEAMRNANGMSDNRHHIVHLQLIDEADRPRFAELNIGATFQSLWAYPDPAALELDIPMLGEKRTYEMYPIASVAAAGGRIVGGSDYWVTDMNPLLAIEVAITRQDPYTNDGPVLNADESVDLETMIAAYTINGAYLMSLEDKQGSIEVGKRADLIVLDRNLFEIPAAEINEADVTMTIFDGRTVYENSQD